MQTMRIHRRRQLPVAVTLLVGLLLGGVTPAASYAAPQRQTATAAAPDTDRAGTLTAHGPLTVRQDQAAEHQQKPRPKKKRKKSKGGRFGLVAVIVVAVLLLLVLLLLLRRRSRRG